MLWNHHSCHSGPLFSPTMSLLTRKGTSTGPYHTAIDKALQQESDASNTLQGSAETTLVWHACSVTYGIF